MPPKKSITFVRAGESAKRKPTSAGGLLATARDWQLKVDLDKQLKFPDHIVATSLRPDVVLWSDSTKQVIMLELTVPWESRIVEAHERKRAKYTELVIDSQKRGWRARCAPVEVGCRGFAGQSLSRSLKLLGVRGPQLRHAIRDILEAAERASRWLWFPDDIVVNDYQHEGKGLKTLNSKSETPQCPQQHVTVNREHVTGRRPTRPKPQVLYSTVKDSVPARRTRLTDMGDSMGDYWRLVRFMVPLACITIAPDIADQALSRSIAFSENVTASYGLAFSLTKFMGGGLQQTRHIGLILVHQAADGQRAVALTVVIGLVVAVIHILIGLTPLLCTPLGLLPIEKAHQVDSVVGAGSRRAMLFLGVLPYPLGLLPIEKAHQVDSVVGAGSRRAMLFLGVLPYPLGLLLIEKAHQVDSVVGAGSRRAMLFLGVVYPLAGLTPLFCLTPLGLLLIEKAHQVDSVVGAGSLTPLGLLLIEKAHQVDSVVGAGSRRAMLFLGGFPLLDGLSFVFIGMLLQYHHSLIVAVSFIADCCAQVVLSLTLMESALQSWDPILIPILAQYAALLVRLSIILAGFLYKVRPKIKQAQPLAEKESFTIVRALKFWWPLALVTVCNKLSRPIINLLVARDLGGTDAVEAVAVLTVVYPIGHMPYSCLNEMKSVVPAFRKRGQGRRVIPWLTLSKFALACLLLVLTVALVVFYVPGITFAIMTGWIETSANIARLCQKPLQIFAFVAVPVGVRAFLSSWLMVQKRTWILTPSAIVRTVALVTALVVLPKLHIRGADMGIAALLTGFLAEVAVVALGFLIIRRRLQNQTPTPDNTETGGATSQGSQTDEADRPMLTEHETTL
ncbi:hypothetical protein Bbelb_327930 [Branchiostoma belcheri]|nr:hypothetical protein Bbelb_327930 [Branchiostoma belcheri]